MATDYFGKVAATYADYRPTYPDELFDWLASQCQEHSLVWDCGAGNGQASVALARHFDKVLATDLSEGQILHATPHPRVNYRVALSDASGLATASADLVTIAQALHWFDFDNFYREVRRVLKPGGLIAAWSYGMILLQDDEGEKDEEANVILQHFYHEVIGPYWPPERHHVETGYSELPFPFERISAPVFSMEVQWTLEQFLGYLRSWSASARYLAANGVDPVNELGHELLDCWVKPPQKRRVQWPLSILAGR